MATLNARINGDESGLENAVTRALGILEKLYAEANKLKIDLVQAGTVEELNSVGTALTAVTGRINAYTNAALKGNTVWQDQQAVAILDTLSAKLEVARGNAELFGQSLATDRAELRAYQSALDSLLKIGLTPTDDRVQQLAANVRRLSASIQEASRGNANPFAQFQDSSGIIGNLENRLRNLRRALTEATDTRQIVSLNRRLRETQAELSRLRGLGDQATGMLGRLEAESKRLRTALSFAQSERELESLGAEIRKVEGEIARLNKVAGVMNRRFGQDGRQSFNQFGLEFGRVIQDLPYAANNFGSVGNNITRMVEVFPGYVASLQATVVASGQAATATNVLRAALGGLFTGMNGLLLLVSAVVTGYTLWQQRQMRLKREAEEAARAHKDAVQVLREYIDTLDAQSRAQARAADGYAQELAQARLLYAQTQDVTLATDVRRKAVEQLQKLFPTYFSGLSREAILAGGAADAYERLTRNLVASQTARVAEELTGEAIKESVQLRLRERNLSRETTAINQRLVELAREERDLLSERVRTQGDVQYRMQRQNEIIKERTELQNQLLANANQQNTDTIRQTQLQGELNEYQEIFNQATAETLANLGMFPEVTKKTAENMKKAAESATDYAHQMANAFAQATNREEVDSRTGLDAMTEKTRQRYEKVYETLNRLQTQWQALYKEGTEERMRLDALASNYRLQLSIAEADELLRNEAEFDAKMAKLRRQQLIDSINVEVDTQRRINERRSQMMMRQLNQETKMWEKAAEDRLKAMVEAGASENEVLEKQAKEKEKIQQQYWKRVMEIQQFERMEDLAIDFGKAVGNAFEGMLSDGKNIFESLFQEFKRMIIRMIAQQAALRATNFFGQLLGIGNVLSGGGRGGINWGSIIKTGISWGSRIFGGSGYSSGSFPTGNFGGGNFPATNPLPSGAGFRPGTLASVGDNTINVNVSGKIGHDAIYLSGQAGARQNNRFYGGK